MFENAPLLQAFMDFADKVKLPFFRTKTDFPVLALAYLPKQSNIRKEDFIFLGCEERYEKVEKSFFVWRILPNESLDNQPIVMANERNFTPIGVVAPNVRAFLAMLAYPQSMRFGLTKTYEYLFQQTLGANPTPPSGKLEWEISQFQEADKKNGQDATNDFLAFLELQKIQPCEDIYASILEAASAFPLLDNKSDIHQLRKNFPNMEIPKLVEDFYLFISKNRIYLPEFEDDCGSHISQSGIIPHFVPAEFAHYFIKLGLTGSGGYYAIWHIFPDKQLVDNPVVYLDSEASPVAVVACNFQEYLRINHIPFHSIIFNIEYCTENGYELEEVGEDALQEYMEAFKADNQADAYENLPERASLYFDFVAQNTPDVQATNPFQIIKNAYFEMPNLLEWLKKEIPERWNY